MADAAKKPARTKATKATRAKATTKKKTTKRAAKPKAAGKRLRVRQVRSGIGHAETFRRTLLALGLRHQREVELPDNPSVRGMVFKVRHLVQVTAEEA